MRTVSDFSKPARSVKSPKGTNFPQFKVLQPITFADAFIALKPITLADALPPEELHLADIRDDVITEYIGGIHSKATQAYAESFLYSLRFGVTARNHKRFGITAKSGHDVRTNIGAILRFEEAR